LSNEQENGEAATAPAKAKTAPPKRVPQPASVEDDDGIPMWMSQAPRNGGFLLW
jgi:hypothetical protein